MLRHYIISVLIMPIMLLSTCGSGGSNIQLKREKKILNYYSEQKKDKYAHLLVDLKNYTTNGDLYQKKYKKHLIGVASELLEVKKFIIKEGSIGFYYDKKSKERDKLYFGLDIIESEKFNTSYPKTAIALIKKNLQPVMETLNSCRTIFYEKEVVGIVVGFHWESAVSNKYNVNVWIHEGDVFLYEDSRLTFNELVHRSTITDTKGEIIRLQL